MRHVDRSSALQRNYKYNLIKQDWVVADWHIIVNCAKE